jgi:hypothetical protein
MINIKYREDRQMSFVKIVHIGNGNYGDVFCKIKFDGGRLSITGVEGPKRNGDAKGGCGQIKDSIEIIQFAPGWDAKLLAEFKAVWSEWHLNDMKAGTPAQEAALKAMRVELDSKYPDLVGSPHAQAGKEGFDDYYPMALAYLADKGLVNDPSNSNYKYGSAWLSVDVPESVLKFLEDLPASQKEPAWV